MIKTLLKHVNLIDGTEKMTLKNDVDILIADKRIEKIDKGIVDDSAKIIDLSGKYITPGLINMHVHIPGSGNAPFKNKSTKKLVKLLTSSSIFDGIVFNMYKKYAGLELKSGVTTLRAVGGVTNFDTRFRDMINEGKVEGPRLFVANSAVSVPGGHMEGTVSTACSNEEEIVKLVQKLNNEKVDLIKVMITGGVLDAEVRGEPGALKMKPSYVKVCCDEAHRLGYKVAAHVESNEGVRVAIENGVDTIEHGAQISNTLIPLAKERGVSLICTLSPALPLALLPSKVSGVNEDGIFNTKVVLYNIISGVNKCFENGIPVGLGNDTGCPFVTHYGFYREMVWFKETFNVSNEFTIYTATLQNAKILGEEKNIGSVEVNKYADLLVLDENPLQNLNAFKIVSMVMKDGKFIKDLKFKKNKYVERSLETMPTFNIKDLENEFVRTGK